MTGEITQRKTQHIDIALNEPVEVPLRNAATGAAAGAFDRVRLVHQALPDINAADVDTRVEFLGKLLSMPLLIGSMTGGTDRAGEINQRLATAAQATGVGMCLGSQRVMIEKPQVTDTFAVRNVAPDILLVANIGAVQLNYGVTADHIRGIADSVQADAVVFHLNAAQEAVQPEGDTKFADLAHRMAEAMPAVGRPCGVKEVGGGMSIGAAQQFAQMPLAFIESAGRGGTSWTRIEGLRSPQANAALGELFADWGVPTVTSLLACVRYGGGVPVVASGGLRSGLDAARAIALGARVTAMALPFLKAADRGVDAVIELIERFRHALATAMFLTGALNVAELQRVPVRVPAEDMPEVYEGRVAVRDAPLVR
ncbi:MAG: type 2 isopentenyl-diphosphate Delta-isomerase [Planctomycetota bacterium]